MESDKLYRVQKEDLPKVEKMLNQCFAHDPLYETLIPDPEVRKNLMPELFKCDMDEFYATCEIFADSADLNSVLGYRMKRSRTMYFSSILQRPWLLYRRIPI